MNSDSPSNSIGSNVEDKSALVIREVRPDDLPQLYQFQREEAGVEMAAVRSRDKSAFDAHWRKILQSPDVVVRAIDADGQLAGSITCFKLDGLNYVGYWLGSEFWGRGIATRALRLLLGEVTVRPLYAHVAEHNVASMRVLEKCGFSVIRYEHSPGGDHYIECEEAVMELQ